ncbi:acetyl-CoA synthetase-like protein [Aspergillus terreus]|uniref:Acetyl-CoA synthetase-like protein n=1 Tax=Aspergillus terreus TaxID=33178 RepID=A0A5M3Z529_ASPTE|nr:hypothetical protein ATETN484_0007039400 [Aspergillus terreus]GFF16199.1 acetyl-CoA synthetase-like protein [Aspergillus terreus]
MHDQDRVVAVPAHHGANVLPNFPLFSKLLRLAHRCPPPIAVRDVHAGVEKTYLQLLGDVLQLRSILQQRLSREILQRLEREDEVYIALLAPGGYEYVVGFLAILAVGAAVVPISVNVPVKEAIYFVQKAQCAAILCSAAATGLARSTTQQISPLAALTIAEHLGATVVAREDIAISSNRFLDLNKAGLVIFTSGTTGPPKGVVHRRGQLTENAEIIAEQYRITDADTAQHLLPVHHATGIGITLLPYLVSGACVEFRSGGFDPAWTWDRWRRPGITVFSGVPTMYTRLKQFFEDVISTMPADARDEYIQAARRLRILLCGTSALPSPVQAFWTELLDGKPILTRYGATEIGSIFKVDLDPGNTPANSVGRLEPGVSIKLTDEGLLLVKGPLMFSKYLFDARATIDSHDEDGYFRTGDVVHQEGSYYTILGRASLDIIKSGGYKLSALDIERELLGLEYISEAMVVGVPDEEFGQRVAAAICLATKHRNKTLTLEALRTDLRDRLAGYKLPTVLRVLDRELPKSGTGKVQKKILGPLYFPSNYDSNPEVQLDTAFSRHKLDLPQRLALLALEIILQDLPHRR